ncbi:MAG TPA: hypothetical protein VGO34_15430 [Alphaproteobacteria bacterium]
MAALFVACFAVYGSDTWYLASMRGLDFSWHVMLGYSFEAHYRHGVDLLFNFGPLSFIYTSAYFEDSHALKITLRLLYHAIIAIGIVHLLVRQSSWRLALWAFLSVFLPLFGDALLLLPVMLLCYSETRRDPQDRFAAAVSVVLCFDVAFAGLVKITPWVFAIPALLMLTIYRASLKERFPLAAACFVGFTAALWLWSGQRAGDFVNFTLAYVDAALAYNADMGLPVSGLLQGLYAAGALLVLSSVSLRDMRGKILAILLFGYVLVAYKMAFMRHGEMPSMAFMALAVAAAAQCSVATFDRSRARRALQAALGVFAALSAAVTGNAYLAVLPSDWRSGYVEMLQERFLYFADADYREKLVSTWRGYRDAAVREARSAFPFQGVNGPIDVFPFEFSLAYASGLPIATRPAFQAYYATSRRMTERNAAFLEGPGAPQSVLFSITPIDGRYPTLEDPLAFRAYRRLYRLDRQTADALLLVRRVAPASETEDCRDTQLAFGQSEPLLPVAPDQAIWAKITLERTWLGRVAEFFVGPPVLNLAISTQGGQSTYRFLREAGESGFLLSPALPNTAAAGQFFDGKAQGANHVAAFRLPTPETALPIDWFQPNISVRLCTLSWGP